MRKKMFYEIMMHAGNEHSLHIYTLEPFYLISEDGI